MRCKGSLEINITPEYHDSDYRFDYEGTARPNPSVSASAQSLGDFEFCEDPQHALEPSEQHDIGTLGRCTAGAVADGPTRLPDASKALIANVTANQETTILDHSGLSDIETMGTADDRRKRAKYNKPASLEDLKNFSRDYKLHTPVPKDLVPFLSTDTAR